MAAWLQRPPRARSRREWKKRNLTQSNSTDVCAAQTPQWRRHFTILCSQQVSQRRDLLAGNTQKTIWDLQKGKLCCLHYMKYKTRAEHSLDLSERPSDTKLHRPNKLNAYGHKWTVDHFYTVSKGMPTLRLGHEWPNNSAASKREHNLFQLNIKSSILNLICFVVPAFWMKVFRVQSIH